MTERKRIDIRGIVQGVGFRPFVFNLARQFGITGWVLNDSFGVTIEAQGESTPLKNFLERLKNDPPVLAQITDFAVKDIQPRSDREFVILESRRQAAKFTLISPDISVCDDCLRELFDPTDRRYRYPFINCTNCGPRFTIIRDIPYDRPQTTMAVFPLCKDCLREYRDPTNRRFHAQPNACPVCGPRLRLTDESGNRMEGDALLHCINFLKEGKIVAVKGLGGFHLAVDATNEEAVRRLRARKHRYEKPLAMMSETVEIIETFAQVHPEEREILESPQRPICLLKKRHPSPIAPSVSPDNDYFGVMLPYTPLHYLLMREGQFTALVMTSGNLSEEPIVYDNKEALQRLHGIADYFLMHNRDIYQRADDSVVRVMGGRISYIRRSRGFVPQPVIIREDLPSVLAVGGELKNTLCLNKERFFFLSQHIGDLENAETLEFFEQSVNHLQKILEIEPQAIAYDLHPEYLSTKWALSQDELPLIGIQHHHAHIAAAMAENGLTGRVIGFSLDGTGYGPDGTIWGGEILLADELDFIRAAHFSHVSMPGGEKAIKEPWRMAFSYCLAAGIEIDIQRFFPDVSEEEANLVRRLIERKINTPLTSSCGRLFDAVAALGGLRHRVGYEGQAAMQLEARLDLSEISLPRQAYQFVLRERENRWEIDWRPLFTQLMEDVNKKADQGIISWKFHNGLVNVLTEVALRLREQNRIQRVVLSGGCFQNRFLTEELIRKLTENNFRVYYHTAVPPNDGGLALGQAYIASYRIKAGKLENEIS